MSNIIGITLRDQKKIFKFIYRLNNLNVGLHVIVKTKKGIEFGKIVSKEKILINEYKPSDEFVGLILRKANSSDFEIFKEIKKLESKAFIEICEKVKKYNIFMKIIDVEYTFDKTKIIIYFSAEERIDFRSLLSEFIKIFKVWIEFKQVNIRESAKIHGGLGICGKIFCCCLFLKEFKRIDMQVALNQGISVSSSKLCGGCGRLLCCLKYEEDTYIENINEFPKINEVVETPKGMAIVSSYEILKKRIKVVLIDLPDALPEYYNVSEIKRIL